MVRSWCALLFLFLLPACASLPKKDGNSLLPSTPPAVSREVLENGLTVLVKEVHRTPVVSIMAYIKTGSAHEGEWTGSGVSHAVEHMFFKGTETKGVGEIEKEIRSYGGDINAFTSQDVTGYTLVVGQDHYEKAIALLSECLMRPLFDPEEFEKEKKVILSEIRMNRDNPVRRAFDLLWQHAYRRHPYRHPIIGYESLLNRLSREDLLRYYKRKYVSDNTLLVIVGDVQTEEALEGVRRHFQGFERGPLFPEGSISEPRQSGRREIREEAPVQVAHLVMGYHTVRVGEEEMYPLDLLAILLGEGKSARLVDLLQRKKELAYTVETSHYTPLEPGLFTIFLRLDEKEIPEALEEIRGEIERITSRPIPEKELEKAKRHVLSRYYFEQETVQSQARDLASNEAAGLSPDFSRNYVKAIASVKPQDIQRAAKEYLTEENLTLVLLVPETNRPVTEEKAASPPLPKREIEKRTLSNGVRVLLLRDPDQPIVSLGISLLGGLRFEQESTEGISNFLSHMFLKGTVSRSEKEISDWVDSRGAILFPFSGQNSLGLRLKLLKGDLLEGIRLLGELIQSPTFPERELEKEKKLILGEILSDNDEIFHVGERLLRKTLYQKHPYRFYPLGREGTISRLKGEDLVAFYKKVFSPQRLVVSAVGDLDVEEAFKEIEKTFSTASSDSSQDLHLSSEEPLQDARFVTQKLPKKQALLLIGFQGVSLKDDDFYPFEVLTKILSGGGGKLYSEIRDKEGQAYTLGSYAVWGVDPGHYVFYVATKEEAVSDVENKIYSEIEQLQKHPLPSAEIERAKESLIGLYRLSLQTPDALSFQASLDELYGLGYDRYRHYESKIRVVTASDLQRIAQTYFDLQRRAVVFLLPEKPSKEE